MSASSHEFPRSLWLRLWSALPPEQIVALADEMAATHAVEDLSLAQSGLGLLPLRDSALAEPYFIGEIPQTIAHVRITNNAGESCEGGAVLVDDRVKLTRALAILDGVLAGQLQGAEQAQALLQQGQCAVQKTNTKRKQLLAATRVNFSLVGDEENTHG